MKAKLIIQWFGIALIIEIGLLHIVNAQAEYEEAAYMGYLFAANFFGALAAAWAIYHKQRWGWILGLFIASGSIVGYVWSRTLGMPGMEVEEWFTPYGIVALGLESVYILLVLFCPWKIPTSDPLPTLSSKTMYEMPVAGLVLILFITVLTYQWNLYVISEYGHHVGSLEQVCDTPVTSNEDMVEQYGIQVSLVANSMLNSIVDVRIKIIDPEKAHEILQNQAALLVDSQALILAPHMHSHNTTRLKEGKIFSMFFPTQQQVHVGSAVNLVFGPVRFEPVVVQ